MISAYPATLISLCLVALPMQWLLLIVGVVAILPFKSTRRVAQRIALAASAILGDASVYTANVAIRQAILTRVRADLDWLASRSKTVVVLAHSQGAAVMYDLLRSIADLGKIRLITYGAGIRKLSELEEDAQRRPLVVSICGTLWLFGLVFALIAWFAAVYTVESFAAPGATAIGNRVGSLLLFYLFEFILLSPFLYHIARGRDEEVDRRLGEDVASLLRKNLQWADIYASSDPVPGGPLLGARAMGDGGEGWRVVRPELEGFRSREVVNLLSTIADHTAYWTIPNDFVPLVARAIRSWVGLPTPTPLNTGRKWRMVFRKMAGFAIAAAAVAAFWRAGDPLRELVWMPAWDLVPIDPASTTARIVVRYRLRDIAVFFAGLALYVGLAVAYARLVLDPAWNAWERTVQNYLRGAEEAPDNLITVLAHFAHLLGPWARLAICMLVVAAPLGMLAGAISRGDYGPTIASVITLGEWGRGIVGWIVLLFMLLAAIGVALGLARALRNGRRGANPS